MRLNEVTRQLATILRRSHRIQHVRVYSLLRSRSAFTGSTILIKKCNVRFVGG